MSAILNVIAAILIPFFIEVGSDPKEPAEGPTPRFPPLLLCITPAEDM